MNPLYPATVILILAIALFYQLIIKPNQDAKNKIKQEAKEKERSRNEMEEIFSSSEFTIRNKYFKGWEYQDFAETEMNATSL